MYRFAVQRDRNFEAARGAMQQGLGSQAQLSGQYEGAQTRDYAKYSQGLTFANDYIGGQVDAWRRLVEEGTDPTLYNKRTEEGKSYFSQEEWDAKLNLAPGAKGGARKSRKNKQTGAWEYVDDNADGVPDIKKKFATNEQRAAQGGMGAASSNRSWELTGQIVEVQDLFKAANDAAKAGDFDAADAKHAEALAKIGEYGLNEQFDPQGLKGDAAGLKFGVGEVYDPMADVGGQAQSALGSPTGMLVGNVVNNARQMMDPNSAESLRFKDALTSGAIAAVEASRTNALRAMATEERGAARSMRDSLLQQGGATQSAKMASLASRAAERFAAGRAGLETQVGAQRAQIYGDAAKVYESFKYDLAQNASALASAWVNDQSGVRDSFRAMHSNMMMNMTSNLYGFASQANNNVTQLIMAANGQKSEGGSGWAGALGGAASGATAGSAAGPWGTVIGGVAGGVAGYFGGQ
ncbi:MAG: hypothetical protein ACRD3A_02800 [Terriglobales bacterium]